MRRERNYIALFALFAFAGTSFAQDYFDDIYYNPKKDTSSSVSAVSKKKTNYIADMGSMDVDTYNRRGNQYYISQIDTIGTGIENAEDFVYTQQIQKYYNPTIVVDNAKALGDVLTNAYGNVDIIINDNGYPIFGPYSGWNYPYYASVWNPWNWGFSFGGWGWSIGWYDPWYSWGWGPGWWNPGPGWGWGPGWWNPGPSWGWGPGWHPGPIGRPGPMAVWNPGGNRPSAPRPGWSNNTQYRGPSGLNHRPSSNAGIAGGKFEGNGNGRPGSSRPTGVVNNNGKWQYNNSNTNNHRQAGTIQNNNISTNRGGLINNSNQSTVGNSKSTVTNKATVTNNRTNTGNTTNNHRSSVSNSRNNNSGSSFRSPGGNRSTGGGSRGGGGGRHR